MGMVERDGDGAWIRFWVSGVREADASEEEREIEGVGEDLRAEPVTRLAHASWTGF